MYKFNSNGVTINLTRDVRHKISSDNCQLKWSVTYKRKQVYYNTGITLNQINWDLLISGSRKKEIKEHSDSLLTYFDNVLKVQVKTLADNGLFTFEALNSRLSKTAGDDLLTSFDLKIEKMKSDDRIGNASAYLCAKNAIVNYTSKKIKISDVTVSWLNGYYKHLIAKGLSYATIGIYLRQLRVILNDGKLSGTINENAYPFGKGKFIIPTAKGRDLSLELSDIQKIAEYDCPSKTIEMCRDLWLFSFLANGVNFADMLTLKFSDIDNEEIYFMRAKTIRTLNEKTNIIIPLLQPLQNIINKWGNSPIPKNLIFPFLNNCKTEADRKNEIRNVIRLTNKLIKKVTLALELPDISTYNARHSYATILTKNRVPESYISECLGHSNKSVTQNYFGHYTKQERINYNSLLLWNK